jgi:flagellar protein FlaG
MDIRPLGSTTQSGSTAAPAPEPTAAATTTPTATGVAKAPAAAAQPVAAVQPEPSLDQVNHAVQKINSAMASQSQGIKFSIDSASHHIVVSIVDQKTNEVLRQIPSKEALAIADSLDQKQGLLIKQQA